MDVLSNLRITFFQLLAVTKLEIGEFKARRHGGAEQGKGTAFDQSCALPNAGGHPALWVLSGGEVLAEDPFLGLTIWKEAQLFDWVAEIEVPQFIGWQAMQGRETGGCDEIINRSGDGFVVTMAFGSPVGFSEIAALVW